jgi:hypothetical protein
VRSAKTGLDHGTDSAEAVDCLDRLRHELLVYGLDAGVVFESARLDPEFAAAQALAAAMHLLTMSGDSADRARPLVAAAVAGAARGPAREQLLVAAIRFWAERDLSRSMRHLETLVEQWPQDLIAARLLQVHQLNQGNFKAMRRTTSLLVRANPAVSHTRGMHAFALAETGALDAAERFGREAADAAFDPWAEHAVSHVLAARRQPRAALAWLLPRAAGWSRCSSFLYTHNWWHVALAHLACSEPEAALALFDTRVWGVRKGYCQDQLNAVSLLARLELHGVDVGTRWRDVADWLAPRTAEHVNGFLDLHYLLGLARAGRDREVETMRRSLAAKARQSADEVWRDIVPMAGEGLVAHARQRWSCAMRLLGQALPRLAALGGSSVQQQLFALLYAHARRASA